MKFMESKKKNPFIFFFFSEVNTDAINQEKLGTRQILGSMRFL